jgi:hypothetical protein
MVAYSNRLRGRLVLRVGLLVSVPVFLAATVVGIAEVHFLTGAGSGQTIPESVGAAALVSALLTTLVIGITLPRCPPVLEGDATHLRYRRLRWVGARPGLFWLEFPISSVTRVGPTALGAMRVDGVALARRSENDLSLPLEVVERLLLAPETAETLGLGPNRGPDFGGGR